MVSLSQLKSRAQALKAEIYALSLAVKHPQTPWYAKLLATGIVAYALSPIDLIPDFVPVLGYLDDFILLPLGITLVLRMIPDSVLAGCRVRAAEAFRERKPVSWMAGGVIVLIWLGVGALLTGWGVRKFF